MSKRLTKQLKQPFVDGKLKEMAKSPKITGWKSLWKNLEWGPRGALIAFVVSSLYFFLPLVPRVIVSLLAVFLATILGSLVGMLFGELMKKAKK